MDTRAQILANNYEAIKRSGFQALRPDKAISELGITKGALYHYFPDKISVGYAVVDELIAPQYIGLWKQLEGMTDHPITNIQTVLRSMKGFMCSNSVSYGCVLNNLMQEMSPLDEGFRIKLKNIIENQRQSIENHLIKNSKALNSNVINNASTISISILASVEGAFGIAKTLKSKETFDVIAEQICSWLEGMK